MSEPTLTPGPWRWFDYPDGRKLLAGNTRAVIFCPDAPMTCDEPDQRLIAAAPELRDLLQRLVMISLDFDEQQQLLRCRICGSERGEFGKLHREGCVIYEAQELLERVGAGAAKTESGASDAAASSAQKNERVFIVAIVNAIGDISKDEAIAALEREWSKP